MDSWTPNLSQNPSAPFQQDPHVSWEQYQETRSYENPPSLYQYPFGDGGGESAPIAHSYNDWVAYTDIAERRRVQNRIAQRNYRKKLKKRLEELEQRAAAYEGHEAKTTGPGPPEMPGEEQPGNNDMDVDTVSHEGTVERKHNKSLLARLEIQENREQRDSRQGMGLSAAFTNQRLETTQASAARDGTPGPSNMTAVEDSSSVDPSLITTTKKYRSIPGENIEMDPGESYAVNANLPILESWGPHDDNEFEEALIKCSCGLSDDKRHIVQCEKCGTWQHVACYYEFAQQFVEVHECVDCFPRILDRRSLLWSLDKDMSAMSSNTKDGRKALVANIFKSSTGLSKSTIPIESQSSVTEADEILASKSIKGKQPEVTYEKDENSSEKPQKRWGCTFPGCKKSFFQRAHLEIHTRAHTGVKPFICSYPACGKRFSQLGNLRAHEERHRNDFADPSAGTTYQKGLSTRLQSTSDEKPEFSNTLSHATGDAHHQFQGVEYKDTQSNRGSGQQENLDVTKSREHALLQSSNQLKKYGESHESSSNENANHTPMLIHGASKPLGYSELEAAQPQSPSRSRPRSNDQKMKESIAKNSFDVVGMTSDFPSVMSSYLDPDQQDLLLAALASDNQYPNNTFLSTEYRNKQSLGAGLHSPYLPEGLGPNFTLPQQTAPTGGFSNAGINESPYFNYIDGDGDFKVQHSEPEPMAKKSPDAKKNAIDSIRKAAVSAGAFKPRMGGAAQQFFPKPKVMLGKPLSDIPVHALQRAETTYGDRNPQEGGDSYIKSYLATLKARQEKTLAFSDPNSELHTRKELMAHEEKNARTGMMSSSNQGVEGLDSGAAPEEDTTFASLIADEVVHENDEENNKEDSRIEGKHTQQSHEKDEDSTQSRSWKASQEDKSATLDQFRELCVASEPLLDSANIESIKKPTSQCNVTAKRPRHTGLGIKKTPSGSLQATRENNSSDDCDMDSRRRSIKQANLAEKHPNDEDLGIERAPAVVGAANVDLQSNSEYSSYAAANIGSAYSTQTANSTGLDPASYGSATSVGTTIDSDMNDIDSADVPKHQRRAPDPTWSGSKVSRNVNNLPVLDENSSNEELTSRINPRNKSNDRNGFHFTTASTPAEFKSKSNITKVRKKSMGSYLKKGKNTLKQRGQITSEDSIIPRTSVWDEQQEGADPVSTNPRGESYRSTGSSIANLTSRKQTTGSHEDGHTPSDTNTLPPMFNPFSDRNQLAREKFRERNNQPVAVLEAELSYLETIAIDNQTRKDSIREHITQLQKELQERREQTANTISYPGFRNTEKGTSSQTIRTPIERTLADIFQQVFNMEPGTIDRHTNFRHLGDSIQELRLLSLMRDSGYDIGFVDFFNHPVLGDLADYLDEQRLNTSPLSDNDTREGTASDAEDLSSEHKNFEPHILKGLAEMLDTDWRAIQLRLPESWMWDVDYAESNGSCWTCTPTELDDPKNFPLTIAGTPVVLPVEYQWPPIGGVNPPPDPRPSSPIDPTAELTLDIIRDLFITFEGSRGFYLLINGLIQIIVPEDFDTVWASSHLPHKYGGLNVCYISQDMEPTMLPSKTETMKSKPSFNSQSSSLSNIFRPSKSTRAMLTQPLRLNDFIEARPKSSLRKDKFSGRIGLKVLKDGDPYLVMSTHVITEAILAKSLPAAILGRNRDQFEKLDGDWNEHAEIWAGNERIGTIAQTFDTEAGIYPNGFDHDITLIKPTSPPSVASIKSPISDLGWLSKETWYTLRQQTTPVKILANDTEPPPSRSAKSLKTNTHSEVLVVGEGIFLNQKATAGSKTLRDYDRSAWLDLVSRALLYRVYPDFDPPNGYSGLALYAEGKREDGSNGPGIVGFQSFVQRSGHVQNFAMEGAALHKRLALGKVAFYGAFGVPDELRKQYSIG